MRGTSRSYLRPSDPSGSARCTLAIPSTEEGIEISKRLGNKHELVWAYNTMTHIHRIKGDEDETQKFIDLQNSVLREAGVPPDPVDEKMNLSKRFFARGDIETAIKLAKEGLAILSESGDNYRLVNYQSSVAHFMREQGLINEALIFYQKSLRLWQDFGHRGAIAHQLECFGLIAWVQERFPRAAKLLSAAEALRETIGSVRTPVEQKEFEEAKSSLQSKMDDFDNIWEQGYSMTMEQAIKYALEETNE